MMLAAVSHTGRTDLVHVHINGSDWHCDKILQPHIVPIKQNNGRNFEHGNARLHTSRLNPAFLQTTFLPWHSESPDSDPIEHLWDELNKHVRQRQPAL